MSLFRNSTTLATRNLLNGAGHVAQWAYSAPAWRNSSFVMTVRTAQILPQPARSPLLQNSGCMWIGLVTPFPRRTRSSGRALQSTSHVTHLTCSFSIRVSSRYDALTPGRCVRLSVVTTYDAPGLDTDHQFHHLSPTQIEPVGVLLCRGLPCAVPCALTIVRVLFYSVSLSSCQPPSTSSRRLGALAINADLTRTIKAPNLDGPP